MIEDEVEVEEGVDWEDEGEEGVAVGVAEGDDELV